ncbi:TPM domain-containing protein [Actinotalea subterranea]|uniref:TPM domain-containing protein n=1 Tax=Actinotalea subterranea TaxID=2607497 RepID=UPI0024827A66|nr:TPM domain-containing protein [Actinotalea subterranea]
MAHPLRLPAASEPGPHRSRRPGRIGGALGVAGTVAMAAALAVGLLATPAAAEPPVVAQDEITDSAGVLGDRTDEVQAALDELADTTRYQLFVVLVDSFDGADPLDWANESATRSGLGTDDLLLAVAVEDRAYGVSVDDAIALSDDQLQAVSSERIEPELRASAWADAAIAAAQGYQDAADGGTGTGTGGGGAGSLLTWLLVGAGVIVLVLVIRSFRRSGSSSQAGGARAAGAQGAAALPTDELNRRASRALVAIDDALKTSEQELGFAQAQFGIEATRTFEQVIAAAKQDVAAAFTLRQQLDDSVPEGEEQRRAMLLEILGRCERADTALDQQTEAFDELRDLQARAPEVLEDTDRRAVEVQGRLPAAEATLAGLATTYRPRALASVSGNVDQARRLLDAARAGVTQGRGEVERDRGAAVALARAAEDAVAQAVTLLDAVARAGQDLAQAGTRIDAGIASLTTDVADAARLAPGDPVVAGAVTAAQAALETARTERTSGDPLAALRRLTEAEAALDAALAPAREQAVQAERARDQVQQVLGRVGSQIRAVGDFIETRRGAVGAEARTRLAEASRLAHEAGAAGADPVRALGLARQAEQLATAAQQLAEADVSRWEQSRGGGYGPGPGSGGLGGNAGSLILGGIILDQILGGGGRSGGFGGGSFGGGGRSGGRSGGFGGSFGGGRSGGRSAGSFGGGGSRGRRGGGGRF